MIDIADDLIPLADVCINHLNLQPHVAARRASLGTLPVPAFRLGGGKRGPLYVKKGDLIKLTEAAYQRAKEATERMHQAGAV